MRVRKQQKGMALVGWVFILGLLAFFSLAIMRLFPLYLEYFNVRSSLGSLSRQSGLEQMSQREVRRLLQRRLDINEVKHVSANNIKLDRSQETLRIAVDYEVRTPFLGNIDLIVNFNYPIEVSLL